MSTKFYGLCQYQPETLKALERYLSGPKSRKKIDKLHFKYSLQVL